MSKRQAIVSCLDVRSGHVEYPAAMYDKERSSPETPRVQEISSATEANRRHSDWSHLKHVKARSLAIVDSKVTLQARFNWLYQ